MSDGQENTKHKADGNDEDNPGCEKESNKKTETLRRTKMQRESKHPITLMENSKEKPYVSVTFLFCERGTTTKVTSKRIEGWLTVSERGSMTSMAGSMAAGRWAWRWS